MSFIVESLVTDLEVARPEAIAGEAVELLSHTHKRSRVLGQGERNLRSRLVRGLGTLRRTRKGGVRIFRKSR